MELSELSGKCVLSPSGEEIGYVKQAYVTGDLTGLAALLCADGEEEEFFLPAKAVVSFGKEIVAHPRRGQPSGVPAPIGRPVFNDAGAFLGTASALTPGKQGVLTVTGLGGTQYYPAAYLSAGDAVIVHPEPAARAAARRKKAAQNKKSGTQTPKNATWGAKIAKKTPQEHGGVPSAEESGYRMDLLGKRVAKPLLSSGGETIAEAGETVTPVLLKRVRGYNRLLELAANTLTE